MQLITLVLTWKKLKERGELESPMSNNNFKTGSYSQLKRNLHSKRVRSMFVSLTFGFYFPRYLPTYRVRVGRVTKLQPKLFLSIV